jgi:hypothetical protein
MACTCPPWGAPLCNPLHGESGGTPGTPMEALDRWEHQGGVPAFRLPSAGTPSMWLQEGAGRWQALAPPGVPLFACHCRGSLVAPLGPHCRP